MKRLLALAASISLLSFAAPAHAADQIAVTAFAGGSPNNPLGNDLPFTVGYTFTPNANITLTQLGLFDVGADGFNESHQIGVWTAGGGLLLSDLVPAGAGATLVNGFRYVDVPDFVLAGGTMFTIGAVFFEGATSDQYIFGPASVLTDPLISFGQGVRSDDNSGFAFPNMSPNTGRFGPNFQFVSTAAPPPVPEPGVWAMMIVGFGLVGGAMRGRRNKLPFVTVGS